MLGRTLLSEDLVVGFRRDLSCERRGCLEQRAESDEDAYLELDPDPPAGRTGQTV